MTSEAPWRHRFAVAVAASTVLLIAAGGLVTSTGSGLAVPDWPLSFGQVFPRMEGGVLFEHGHRLIAATVGLLTIMLAAWTQRTEPRAGVRRLGWAMLGLVVFQGVLGGMTVLLRLPTAVSVAHAATAQLFLALTVVMAAVTTPELAPQPPRTTHHAPAVSHLAVATMVAVYLQILLGAVVRHTGAGLAIPTFPLANGRLVPEFTNYLVGWQFAHRAGAAVVAILVLWTSSAMLRGQASQPWLVRPAVALLSLLVVQILLGGLTIWKMRAVTPTTAHVVTGALLFATTVLLTVRTRQAVAA